MKHYFVLLFIFLEFYASLINMKVIKNKFVLISGQDSKCLRPVIKTMQLRSKVRCGEACMSETLCGGFNFKEITNSLMNCEILHGLSQSGDIQFEADSAYYEIVTMKYPRDCHEYYTDYGYSLSGVYRIDIPYQDTISTHAYCDMDTDGGRWTVILSRHDGSEDFDRNWTDYKYGFGNRSGEYYMGNDAIHGLTEGVTHEMRVDMENFSGDVRYAVYDDFYVNDEADNYRLNLGSLSDGDAGESFGIQDNMEFSSPDRDNDNKHYNCALKHHGAFWYNSCSYVRLTSVWGENVPSETENTTAGLKTYSQGIIWATWMGFNGHPETAVMMIRPKL